MTAAILSNGRAHAAVRHGRRRAGRARASTASSAPTARVETLGHIGSAEMQPGDVFVIETPGGGGFGQP